MDIKECVIIKNYIKNLIDYHVRLATPKYKIYEKELKQLVKVSKDIFCMMYEDKHISTQNQFLLYLDDIVFLDINYNDFRKKYFPVHMATNNREVIIFGSRQFGDFLIITIEDAKKILKRSRLKTFQRNQNE